MPTLPNLRTRSPRSLTGSPPTRPRGTGARVVAHRGASHDAPENTLSALRLAVALGADALEVDLRRTADGALVLAHDATLERTTDAARALPGRAPWQVGELSLEQLRRLDFGSWKSPAYAGEPVCLLHDVLDLVEATGVGLLLEVKAPDRHPGIVDDLAAALRARPGYLAAASASGRLVVQSFDVAAMKDLKTRVPELGVGLLGAPPTSHLAALGTWAAQVNPRHRRVNGGYVAAVHAAGMECCAWTVDSPVATRRVLRAGVDAVITNRPDLVGRVVAETLRTTAAAG